MREELYNNTDGLRVGAVINAGDSANTTNSNVLLPKRRFKKYRYRKVLVPSQEQLSLFKLKDGLNQIAFDLDGCPALKSSLFLWPAHAKIVVADLEGVFGKSRLSQRYSSGGATTWMSFFGGNNRPHESSIKDFDCSIELFCKISSQGYKIIYIAQSSMTKSPPSMQSSADYLQSIKTSDGRFHLPVGPIFKSPDSLVRAFGHTQTAMVFRAAALRGVKSLFPSNYNPFHAYFSAEESDPAPFERFGFSEGRIFLVGNNVIHTAANRTCVLSFQRLKELLFEVFPFVKGTQQYCFFFKNKNQYRILYLSFF
jgi:phosphatidate phosphatase LPIN